MEKEISINAFLSDDGETVSVNLKGSIEDLSILQAAIMEAIRLETIKQLTQITEN